MAAVPRHRLKQRVAYSVVLSLGCILIGFDEHAGAACAREAQRDENKGRLIIHLPSNCMLAEKELHAVSGTTIMDAVRKGWSVDLMGVLVRGDLSFDALSAATIMPDKGQPPEPEGRLGQRESGGVRTVSETITIRDSVVVGSVRHRSTMDTLRFEAPIDLRGTRFRGDVDLSRSVFQDGVEISGATFEKEAYFVQAQFINGLNCKETKFGPHTRFHRSTFRGPVDCAGALFDGMAEFLEVTFDEPITFERARFGLGTGFSGSRFKRRVNFDEAIFSRETFFLFSVFEDESSFAGAQFLGKIDFSDAEFTKLDNLAKARFDYPPLFSRTKRVALSQPAGFMDSPTGPYTVTLFVLLMAAVLVGYVLRMK